MSREHPLAIVARRLAAYLPPGAVETECTLPVATLDDWLREAGAPPLPPEARSGGWWADLHRHDPHPGLPGGGWRVERLDWEGAGITFVWADASDGAGSGG